MSKKIRKIEHNDDLHDVLVEMFNIIANNIETGNISCISTGYKGDKYNKFNILKGKKINYNSQLDEPLYADNPDTDIEFLSAFGDLSSSSIEDRKKRLLTSYVVINDGNNYALYSYIDTDYGTALKRVMELGKYDSFHRYVQDIREMEPGEFEFLSTRKMRLGTHWSNDNYYEIEMSPEDLVKNFAGTKYEGFGHSRKLYKTVEQISGNPGSLRRDSYYNSFETIQQIAEKYGLDYRKALLGNLSQADIELIERTLHRPIQDIPTEDITQIMSHKYCAASLEELNIKLRLLEEEAKKMYEIENTIEKFEDAKGQKSNS